MEQAIKKDVTLDDFLEEVMPDVGGEVVLDDPGAADKQIQKIARLREQADKVMALVNLQMEQLHAWEQQKLDAIRHKIDWYSKPLELAVRREYDKSEGATKSIDLPHGKLQLVKDQDHYEYDDEKIKADVAAHPQLQFLVKQRPMVDHSALKKHIKQTGELLDGVTITPAGEPKFHIQFKKKEATDDRAED